MGWGGGPGTRRHEIIVLEVGLALGERLRDRSVGYINGVIWKDSSEDELESSTKQDPGLL